MSAWSDWQKAYLTSYLYGGGGHAYKGVLNMLTGKSAARYTKASNQAQIDYDQYLRVGNVRAYNDWQKNVGSKGRTIRYPELSYPGAIYRADTGIARSMYSNYSADANYYGNLPYRGAGLYGIASRASHFL